jgi:hypothetical protein
MRAYRIDPVNAAALARNVARCREFGCEVILLIPPMCSTHRAGFTPEIDAAAREMMLATGCRHVDTRDWMADEFFTDSHHLAPDGGRLFTRRLVREVLGP